MYDMSQASQPMNYSDLFTAQNLGMNPPPMSGAQSPWSGLMGAPQPMPQQPVQMPPEINHLNDVIQQYTQNKQDQQNNSGLVQQILSNRMQPTLDDASQSTAQTAQSFLAPHLFQPQTPDQAMAQRYQTQLAPYTQGLQLANQSAELTGRNQTNDIQAQTGLPMAMASLQHEQMANDIMAKTGMDRATAEIALQQAQAGQAGAMGNYYNSALQRDLAEKLFDYQNNPQMAQAKMMAQYMGGLGGGQASGAPGNLPQSMLSPNGTLPSTAIPTMQGGSNSQPQVNPTQGATPPSGNIGFNPMGAMLAKQLGLTDMQIGPNGQPMPIPGAMKIENGSVITIGPDGKPTSTIPQNPAARNSMEQTVDYLSGKLDELKNNGSAVDESQPWLENQFNAAMSNKYMQPMQAGNKAQTIRSEMASYVMSALPDYMQAKGITPGMERSLGGQELILKAIGIDPSNSVQANKEILRNISRVSGTGDFAKQLSRVTVISPTGQQGTIDPSELQSATQNGWKQVQ